MISSVIAIVLVFVILAIVILSMNGITFETALDIPVNRLPVYLGNSTPLFDKVTFTFSNESYENCQGGFCFLVDNGEIKDFPENYKDLRYSGELVEVTDDESAIIKRIENGEFSTLGPTSEPQYPMSGLGSVKIINAYLGYYNEVLFHHGTGGGRYVPFWILYAETSGYGDETILVLATK